MRHFLKSAIIAAIAFYVAYNLVPTIGIGTEQKNVLAVIGGIFLVSIIIRPIFSIILLPINILTFGLLSLVLNFALIIALVKFLPGFAIYPYNFPGAEIQGFIIPPVDLNMISTIIVVAAIITVAQKILHIVFE